MPCYDSRNEPEYIYAEKNKEIESLRKRNDELTRMLCGLCTEIELAERWTFINSVPGLTWWWEEHKAFDRKRKSK